MEMLFAVSESSCNNEHVPYVMNNTVKWLNQRQLTNSYPLFSCPSPFWKYPLSPTLLPCNAVWAGNHKQKLVIGITRMSLLFWIKMTSG